jgi:hypothetical protein
VKANLASAAARSVIGASDSQPLKVRLVSRVVSKLAAAEGGVPTDNDFVAWQRSRRLVVKLEPRPLDKIAASWNRRLLILSREFHCTHRRFQFIESTSGFPFRMKQTTHPTTKAAGRA